MYNNIPGISSTFPFYQNVGVGEKRKREEEALENKRQKLKRLNPEVEWNGVYLPEDVFNKILSYLSYQEVLKVESLVKYYSYLTIERWKEFKREKYFNFDWSICNKEMHKEKYCYLLSRAIHVYFHKRFINKKNVTDPTFYQRFEGLMIRFPSSFGTYLLSDLTSPAQSYYSELDSKPKFDITALKESIKSHEGDEVEELEGGDLLLRGLYQFNSYIINSCSEKEKLNSANQYLIQAIKKKATCAGYFAYFKNFNTKINYKKNFYDLGVLSASYQDYRLLDYLMINDEVYAHQLRHAGDSPSTLLGVAQREWRCEYAVDLYDEAIKGYGEENVTPQVWKKAACVLFLLGRWEEAQEYYEKAIKGYEEENVPPNVWRMAALVEIKLGNKEKAKEYCKKAIKGYECETTAAVDLGYITWADIAYVNMKLEKWEKAEKYYDKTIESYRENDGSNEGIHLSDYWADIAFIKMKLEKWEQVKKYYEIAAKVGGECLFEEERKKMDEVKEYLQKKQFIN